MQDPKDIRRKQLFNGLAIAIAIGGVVMAGLAWQDSKNPKHTTVSNTPKEADLAKSFTSPVAQQNPADQWMSTGSKAIADEEAKNAALEQRLEHLEQQTSQADKDKAAQANAVPLPPSPTPTAPMGGAVPDKNAQRTAIIQDAARKASLLPPPPPSPSNPPEGMGIQPMGGAGGAAIVGQPVKQQQDNIQVIDFGNGPSAAVTPAGGAAPGGAAAASVTDKNISTFVPAGSFATVTLLNGVDAPTGGQAANQALPIVMRVKSFMHLPNNFKSNLRECFITGNAYGDLASERAYIRTDKLSCVLRDGRVLQVSLKGHIAGEDGTFGMRGKVVSKQGQLLAMSFFSGLFSGIGTTLAAQTQSVNTTALGTVATIQPDKIGQAGLANGVAVGSNKIGEFYLQQANSIFPIIEIAAKRIGEVYLMDGVDFGNASISAGESSQGG